PAGAGRRSGRGGRNDGPGRSFAPPGSGPNPGPPRLPGGRGAPGRGRRACRRGVRRDGSNPRPGVRGYRGSSPFTSSPAGSLEPSLPPLGAGVCPPGRFVCRGRSFLDCGRGGPGPPAPPLVTLVPPLVGRPAAAFAKDFAVRVLDRRNGDEGRGVRERGLLSSESGCGRG